ncbi:hypothetical protein CC2G_014217 [Coprinopsis cinerea AmutBmut pab1-1]|nr:hypothetical protein CC2G_014217 [Coprinopsis cinerea AmutBmut pab1-1]
MAKKKSQQKKKKGRGRQKQVELVRRQVGLLVTKELEVEINACREEVEKIAKDCKDRNAKFRDPDFDLTRDWERCIYGMKETFQVKPSVRRVTEIFDKPKFFNDKGAAESSAIHQGCIGDCYFLAGLGTVCCIPGLIEKICVARDEEVGVYGFIFFQDDGWCRVIVDDLLPIQNPRHFDSLDDGERQLFVEDRDLFHHVQKNRGSRLTYAKSGSDGETWVPLIEKAYAKLYGSYEHLDGGWATEAIEDLSGGVSMTFYTQDILDRDRFWKEEMAKANTDRLLSASFFDDETQGLISGHAYSVLKAIEWNGKRFVLVRNPWGDSEWEGPWSDGSKEWEPQWLGALKELNHVFGDDGKFVMEYDDFLKYFEQVGRTFLFDESWVLVSEWMKVDVENVPELPSYGNLSYKVTIPEPTKAIICLSKLNTRGFKTAPLGPPLVYQFAIVKAGERKPLRVSPPTGDSRVTLELDLEAATYMIYVKTEHESTIDHPTAGSCNPIKTQTVAKLLASKVKSLSLVKSTCPWQTRLTLALTEVR